MATRRSKRLGSSNATASLSEDVDSPARKRRAKIECESDMKPVTPSSSQDKTSAINSEDAIENNSSASNSRRPARKSVKKTKSSYFESPVASEASESEDEIPRKVPNRKSSARSKSAKSKFESSDDSEEYDSESENFKPSRKRKPSARKSEVKPLKKLLVEAAEKNIDPIAQSESNAKFIEKLTQRCMTNFESESDSSSEDDVKPSQKVEPSQLPSLPTNSSESDDEPAAENNNPAEFFDFSAVVSQITQANSEEKNESEETKQTVKIKKEPEPGFSIPIKKKAQSKKVRPPAKETKAAKTEGMEVFELLAMGEETDMSAKDIKESVNEAQEQYEVPKQVEVLLDAPALKKKKKCDDLEMALRRRLNNIRRENQVYIHKVHILCWIAHGIHLNRILNSAHLLGTALSLIPSEKCYPPKRMDISHLELLIKWFREKVKLKKDPDDAKRTSLIVSLRRQFENLEAETKLDLCFMFICVMRALGIKCRLVINLNVAPMKPTSDQLLPVTQKKEDEKPPANKSATPKLESTEKKKQESKKSVTKEKESTKSKSHSNEKKKPETQKSVSKESEKNSKKKVEDSKSASKKKSTSEDAKDVRRSSRASKPKSSYFNDEISDDEKDEQEKKTSQKSSSKSSKDKSRERESTTNEIDSRRSSRRPCPKSEYFSEEKSTNSKHRSSEKKSSSKTQKIKEEPLVEEMSTSDSDESANEFRTPKKKKINRKVISTDDEADVALDKDDSKSRKQPKKANYWIEVFLEAEEKWTSVDIANKTYMCDEELSKTASLPVRYVLAWNNDQTIKDVTKRYARQFLTVTRKLRVDDDWWAHTMGPFKPLSTPQEREEDEELDRRLEDQPLPKTISEYKNHPLYALTRHLLKFQAIYPPDAPTLGFVGKEPVYSRACVHQLHGREMWIKEAKVVKLNEKPYKIVKGRQKKDKFGTGEGPRDLELFGLWQVEDYVPPTAENGKVPRNAFGNVELFKMSMLPKGTVYLQVPGLQRIANKLNIDCAQAITGFEYSTNGWSYPVKDGFVVCEEFKDILLDAFNQEVEEAEKKEKRKREERIYGNWKRLIRGLFIAEKLKRKYNFGDFTPKKKEGESSTSQKSKAKAK